jgi:hypothetical protein
MSDDKDRNTVLVSGNGVVMTHQDAVDYDNENE